MGKTPFALDETQRTRAEGLVEPALGFLGTSRYALGAALVRHLWPPAPIVSLPVSDFNAPCHCHRHGAGI